MSARLAHTRKVLTAIEAGQIEGVTIITHTDPRGPLCCRCGAAMGVTYRTIPFDGAEHFDLKLCVACHPITYALLCHAGVNVIDLRAYILRLRTNQSEPKRANYFTVHPLERANVPALLGATP